MRTSSPVRPQLRAFVHIITGAASTPIMRRMACARSSAARRARVQPRTELEEKVERAPEIALNELAAAVHEKLTEIGLHAEPRWGTLPPNAPQHCFAQVPSPHSFPTVYRSQFCCILAS